MHEATAGGGADPAQSPAGGPATGERVGHVGRGAGAAGEPGEGGGGDADESGVERGEQLRERQSLSCRYLWVFITNREVLF